MATCVGVRRRPNLPSRQTCNFAVGAAWSGGIFLLGGSLQAAIAIFAFVVWMRQADRRHRGHAEHLRRLVNGVAC
jgi:hypothetical protein